MLPLSVFKDYRLVAIVFINKVNGGNNIAGKTIASLRQQMNISQRQLADKMQLVGIDIDKNAIQRIEARKRFITDIELAAFAKVFSVSVDSLLKCDNNNSIET